MSGLEPIILGTAAAAGAETAAAAAAATSAATVGYGAIGATAAAASSLIPATAAATTPTLFGALTTALASAAPYVSTAAGLASVGGTVLSATQRAAALRTQAGNTALAADQAQVAAQAQELAGRADALRIRQQLVRTLATQTARYGAAGVSLDSGAPQTVADASAAEADLNLAIVQGNAGIASADQRLRAIALAGQSSSLDTQAGVTTLTGGIAAGASLFDLVDRRLARSPGTARTASGALE